MKEDLMACIVLPKYSNSGQRIDSDMLSKYSEKMSKEYGGVTVRPTSLGCWEDESGKLICEENVVMCFAINTEDLSRNEIKKKKNKLIKIARESGEELGQAEVMVWFDTLDSVTFVRGRFKKELPSRVVEHDFFKRLLD